MSIFKALLPISLNPTTNLQQLSQLADLKLDDVAVALVYMIDKLKIDEDARDRINRFQVGNKLVDICLLSGYLQFNVLAAVNNDEEEEDKDDESDEYKDESDQDNCSSDISDSLPPETNANANANANQNQNMSFSRVTPSPKIKSQFQHENPFDLLNENEDENEKKHDEVQVYKHAWYIFENFYYFNSLNFLTLLTDKDQIQKYIEKHQIKWAHAYCPSQSCLMNIQSKHDAIESSDRYKELICHPIPDEYLRRFELFIKSK
jgi:hypothetical protein